MNDTQARTWSPYQEAIFDFVAGDKRSLLVEAVAGSGKTTTIVEAIRHVPESQSVAFLAFNKSIADELKRRVTSPNAKCMTLHAAGFNAWRQHISWDAQNLQVDSRKTSKLLDELVEQNVLEDRDVWTLGGELGKLIGIAKSAGIVPNERRLVGLTPDDTAIWQDLVEFYGLDEDKWTEDAINIARKVLSASIDKAGELIDFDDMLYMPVISGSTFEKYDVVFLDEAQDVSGIQVEMVDRMRHEGSRVVAVGDRHQCQPTGTLVSMTGGDKKPIEEVRIGDEVVSYERHGAAFVGRCNQGRKVLAVGSRNYKGELIVVSAGEKESRCTPEHRWLVRFNDFGKDQYLLYLMLKGDQGRIGVAQTWYDCGFGPSARARAEGADAIWVLSAHPTKSSAWLAEQVVSAKYGLPQLIFQLRGQQSNQTQEEIDKALIQIGPNLERVENCLKEYGRLLEHPLWTKDEVNYAGARYPFVTAASNLMSRVMSANIFEGQKNPDWQPLDVDREQFSGIVCSLKIETHELYVADGLLTHNSIYGFRGALSNSMDNIKERFDCEELPLSVSYRCPVVVVEHVKQWVPQIEHWADAAIGDVSTPESWNIHDFRAGDAILCRVARPVVDMAFRLIRNKIPAKVAGRDIGQGLIKLIDKMKAMDLIDLDQKLLRYREREVTRAKGDLGKIAAVDDKIDTLRVFMDELGVDGSIHELKASIESLFGENMDGARMVVLSTVHKAKGLEWPRVFVLDSDLYMPSKWARQPWQRQQEANLCYVAGNRSKLELHYISSLGVVERQKDQKEKENVPSSGSELA
jgi:superfamily I DNA/RNA helicase